MVLCSKQYTSKLDSNQEQNQADRYSKKYKHSYDSQMYYRDSIKYNRQMEV